jgi:HSP20 family molecular chaperone IbpA
MSANEYIFCNILEDGRIREVAAEMVVTGFKREDINIKIDGNIITIIGEAKKEIPDDNMYFLKQSSVKYFKKVLTLHEEVEKVYADLEDEILKMRIFTRIAKKPTSVKVEFC